MIRCSQARRRILASRDARLSLTERLELDEHLAGCEACRQHDALDAGLEQAVAALPGPPVEQLDLDAAVRAVGGRIDALEREAAEHRARRATAWRRVSFAAAAAAVVLVAWSLLGRRAAAPGTPESPPTARTIADREPAPPVPRVPPSAEDPRELESERALAAAEQVQVPGDSDAQPPPEPQAEPGLELERLERARSAVREAFLAAVDAEPGSGQEAATLDARLARTHAPLSELAGEGWPVTRLAERVLSDPDPEVAALATRWLGREGDRLSIGTIASLLRRPDVSTELREQAVLALLDDGDPGIEALAPALDDKALRPVALEGLVTRGGALASRLVEEALVTTGTDRGRASDLAQALAQLGEPGRDALLRAVALRGAASGAALEQLRRTRGAPERLAAQLGQRAPSRIEDARLIAAAHLGLAEALPRLHERALERARRARALEGLVAFDGDGALAVLLDLWGSGRLPEDELVVAARARLERDPGQAVALCDELMPPAERTERLANLLDLLLSTESPAAAPALAHLVDLRVLGLDERQWAALALVELGSEREALALARTLRSLQPDEDRLAAACALAIHAIAGPDALREALGPAAVQRGERLIALYQRRRADHNQVATLSRASRLLEPWLDPDNPERTRTTP